MNEIEAFISELPGETDKLTTLAETLNRLYPEVIYLLVIHPDGKFSSGYDSKHKAGIPSILRALADQLEGEQ